MGIHWSKISLFFLFVVALIGTVLRAAFLFPIPLKYANLVHAHSHVAFQGWIYTLMFLFLTNIFLTKDQIRNGRYPLQFKLTVFIVVGVLISFSLQGYALYSIIFSTLFQLLNYWFIFRFLKDIKQLSPTSDHGVSLRFIKTGLWLGLLSTLVPFVIGFLSAKGLSGTEVYQSAVYTFLHLQYNGWFLFVAFGLFFKLLESRDFIYNQKHALKFYWLFTIAVIPAIALSLMGMKFSQLFVPVAWLAAILQGFGILYFLFTLKGIYKGLFSQKKGWTKLYLLGFLACFTTKVILQCISVLPALESYAFFSKPIILAYLHLSLIGVISFLFLCLLMDFEWVENNRVTSLANLLLVLGFALTELVLVLSGLKLVPYNQMALLIGSATMALGIFLLATSRKKLAVINRKG